MAPGAQTAPRWAPWEGRASAVGWRSPATFMRNTLSPSSIMSSSGESAFNYLPPHQPESFFSTEQGSQTVADGENALSKITAVISVHALSVTVPCYPLFRDEGGESPHTQLLSHLSPVSPAGLCRVLPVREVHLTTSFGLLHSDLAFELKH